MKTCFVEKVILALAFVSLFVGVFTLHAAIEDTIKKDFQVKPGTKLVVAVDRGSIDVKSVDSDHVQIEVKRKLDKMSEAGQLTLERRTKKLAMSSGKRPISQAMVTTRESDDPRFARREHCCFQSGFNSLETGVAEDGFCGDTGKGDR